MERRLGPCAVVCVLGVCPSMVVLVLSVQCLPPLSPLSDVDCHVMRCECVLRCRMTVFAEAGRCPPSQCVCACVCVCLLMSTLFLHYTA